jgi:hypothetical protein
MTQRDFSFSDVEYRDVPGFPGYRVGSDGSVWSGWRTNGKRSDEYKRIAARGDMCVLRKDGQGFAFKLTSLQAIVFKLFRKPREEMKPHVTYKPIPSFPGYRIGSDGTVWSCFDSRHEMTGEWRRIGGSPNRDGYPRAVLSRGGRKHQFAVHRLVLQAFIGPCPPGEECRHLDGNPGNAALSNLVWGTHRENEQDKLRHGTYYRRTWKSLPPRVEAVRAMAKDGRKYTEIAAVVGISATSARRIAIGLTSAHLPGPIAGPRTRPHRPHRRKALT